MFGEFRFSSNLILAANIGEEDTAPLSLPLSYYFKELAGGESR
jgi:hypothetical protein